MQYITLTYTEASFPRTGLAQCWIREQWVWWIFEFKHQVLQRGKLTPRGAPRGKDWSCGHRYLCITSHNLNGCQKCNQDVRMERGNTNVTATLWSLPVTNVTLHQPMNHTSDKREIPSEAHVLIRLMQLPTTGTTNGFSWGGRWVARNCGNVCTQSGSKLLMSNVRANEIWALRMLELLHLLFALTLEVGVVKGFQIHYITHCIIVYTSGHAWCRMMSFYLYMAAKWVQPLHITVGL